MSALREVFKYRDELDATLKRVFCPPEAENYLVLSSRLPWLRLIGGGLQGMEEMREKYNYKLHLEDALNNHLMEGKHPAHFGKIDWCEFLGEDFVDMPEMRGKFYHTKQLRGYLEALFAKPMIRFRANPAQWVPLVIKLKRLERRGAMMRFHRAADGVSEDRSAMGVLRNGERNMFGFVREEYRLAIGAKTSGSILRGATDHPLHQRGLRLVRDVLMAAKARIQMEAEALTGTERSKARFESDAPDAQLKEIETKLGIVRAHLIT